MLVITNYPRDWQYKTVISHPADTPAIWVYGISITPDGKKLVNAYGGGVFIWDLKTGKLDHFLDEHSKCVFNLAISPNGQNLASGSLDKTVKIWNLHTGELISTLAKRADPINCVAFSHDGKILACGGTNKYKNAEGKTTTTYLWNPETEELIGTLTGHYLRVQCIAFSPNNQIIVTGSYDKTIKVWDINTQELLYTLTGHLSYVGHLLILPDCQTLISSGGGGIKFWNLTTGKLLSALSEDSEYIRSFAINHNYQILASTNSPHIKIWNLQTKELIHTLEFSWAISITFSPDGKLLASGNALGEIRVWEIPDDFLIKIQQKNVLSEIVNTEINLEKNGYFNPENLEDARKRVITSIVRRQGQSTFRKTLIQVYNCKCVITGCNAEQVLEAAHIIPYLGSDTNHPTNGLLLRADIHTLFDLYLIAINPDKMTVEISNHLKNTSYGDLAGNPILIPQNEDYKPNKQALEKHYQIFYEKQNCLYNTKI
ncbi:MULTISPECIES: HNH endonuclease [unclassified Nodularia (in: cyanobacteria)]|uniref:HNH endonuclease n=1 Tax=unclassified Nodularia (in: cyanobacteria) TaxID=2656917 RepID=UPI00187EBCA4|nr:MULTISPECIES: HNH endonuclease [unclassified Nodularia (in: cyanobacteria)]MBE9198664.1 HNH endonuclease [Nodularia sp. LEGE 06071]MCC2691766.1 HNH endonuclease [Nodularia sp. LEGE 04288]